MTINPTIEDLELLFGRVVNRVILGIVPVVMDDCQGHMGLCRETDIVLAPNQRADHRLFALLHELTHWVLHFDHERGVWPADQRGWEFEANQVAAILCARLGLRQVDASDDRYDTEEVLGYYPLEYYQERIERAVVRIWQVIGE